MQQPMSAMFPPAQTSYLPLSEAEIYAIKRQYLGLLPLQQIIDICLTFEAHAPLHIKSSVWPYDIRAAIASIQAQKAQASQTQTSSDQGTTSKTPAPDVDSSSGERKLQPLSSTTQQSTPGLTQPGLFVNTPSVPQTPTPAPGSHYPHQPYYHPTYPQAPYYTHPHTTFGYSHPPYPQPAALYPVNPPGHHPALFTGTPLVHPPHPASELPPTLNNTDDLPSYEEMIVEALLDSGDPEGCAPKDLFGWMAMHYPLQMNFRPSASQALQKAYKRGRLEKGNNGKYRLNENWEGGNTSRRTTRRPQTLAQATLPIPQPPSSSPFTHTPLLPHGTTHLQSRLPPPGQPPGYGGFSFGYPYRSAPGTAHAPPSRDNLGTGFQKQPAETPDQETGEGNDAWEAAQNILKAINFGQLFQISNEEAPSASADSLTPHASTNGSEKPPSASGTTTTEDSTGSRINGGKSAELNAEQRAALQAQLALLAAQLAELADVSEDELSHNLEVSQGMAPISNLHNTPQVSGDGSGAADDSDEDNVDMVEVPMPMAALVA